MPRSRASFVVVCLGALASAEVVLSQAIPLGSELQVNAYTSGVQISPAVGMRAGGDFVVAWSSEGQDGSYYAVVARRFNSAGVGLGAEFLVNVFTTSTQGEPAVGMSASGDFVVVWQSDDQEGTVGGIFGRRFNSAGVGLGVEFQVNTHTLYFQRSPAVDMDDEGDFVVAWHSSFQDGSDYGVFGQLFTSAGVGFGAEFQINTYTMGRQALPAVAMDSNGDFVVAWHSLGQDGSDYGVFAQRFNLKADPLGEEFQINTNTSSTQSGSAVGMDSDGDFVVAWQSSDQDGSSNGIFVQRFNAAGEGQGAEFQVNAFTSDSQKLPAVGMDGDGDFVVTWNSLGQDGSSYGIFARHFNAAGEGQGAELLVNTFTSDGQKVPAVGMDGDGDFVVAWSSLGQDGSSYGVFAQRFETLAILDIDGNGSTGALTDGLLVLRFLFGFTGATLVNGVVDVGGCTRCDAPTIDAYLQTLI